MPTELAEYERPSETEAPAIAGAPIVATILVVLVFLGAGCTFEDGQPWGVVDVDLSVTDPYVDDNFEATSFEVDIEGVHLLALDDGSAGAPADNCHGDHCHGAEPDEHEAHDDAPGAREIAHFEIHEPITSLELTHLGEAAIGERVAIERVDTEIHELVVEGVLTRDGEDVPTTIHLEHIPVSGDVQVSFGPDSPEHQQLSLQIWWAEHWLEDIDLDQLEANADGHIVISHDANHEAAEAISRYLTETRLRHVPPIGPQRGHDHE